MMDKYMVMWTEFRKWVQDYEEEHHENVYEEIDGEVHERYCVALSCDDILEKMDKLEKDEK